MASLRFSLRVTLAAIRREWWINLRAYRISFFLSSGLASLFTLLIGYFMFHDVFQQRVTPEFVALTGSGDYLSYLTIGVLVYLFAVRMLYPVRDFLAEQWEGTLPVITMIGMPRLSYHLGCMSFSAVYAALEVAVVAAVASTFLDLELAGVDAAGVAVAAAASFFGTFGFSLAMAAVILAVRDRLVIEGAAFSLMSLLSGVSFPTSYLPAVIQPLAEVLPLTHALRALRAAALEQAGPAEIVSAVAALVLLGAAYLVLGTVLLDRAIRRTVEQTA